MLWKKSPIRRAFPRCLEWRSTTRREDRPPAQGTQRHGEREQGHRGNHPDGLGLAERLPNELQVDLPDGQPDEHADDQRGGDDQGSLHGANGPY
jgi:hypothetical protein